METYICLKENLGVRNYYKGWKYTFEKSKKSRYMIPGNWTPDVFKRYFKKLTRRKLVSEK